MENTAKKVTRESIVYDTVNMTVFAFGATWAYWRYDVTGTPDEVKLYALKGFIDDLRDCTTGIKKGDYKDTDDGRDAYRLDCLAKRRELEKHINAGTRPRVATGKVEDKKAYNNAVAASKVVSLEGLLMKKTMYPAKFTEQDQADYDRLMDAAIELRNAGKQKTDNA